MKLSEVSTIREMLQTMEFNAYEGEWLEDEAREIGRRWFDNDDMMNCWCAFISVNSQNFKDEATVEKLEAEVEALRKWHTEHHSLYTCVVDLDE